MAKKYATIYRSVEHAIGKDPSEFTPYSGPIHAQTPGVLSALDLFSGAGGFSQGLMRAAREAGFHVKHRLLNHWHVALESARANLGDVTVFNGSIQDYEPLDVVPEGYLDLLLASPECVMYSNARGARPINDQRRSTAADILRFLEVLDVRTFIMENVSEMAGWGPLDEKTLRPITAQKGVFFRAFVKAIENLGYDVQYQDIVAADMGGATTRKRLFLIAQKGRRASFPARTHSKDGAIPGTLPWVPARSIIDFSQRGLSIFTRPSPHVPKTLRRVAVGFAEQVSKTPLASAYVEAVDRFRTLTEHYYAQIEALPTRKKLGRALTKEERAHVRSVKLAAQQQHRMLVEEAMSTPVAVMKWEDILLHESVQPTISDEKRLTMGTLDVVDPVITKLYGTGTTTSVNDPLDTITAGGQKFGLAQPLPDHFLVTINHAETSDSARKAASIDDPLATVTTKGSQGVVSPFCRPANASQPNDLSGILPDARILPQQTYDRDNVASPDTPLPTVTAISRHGLVQADATPVEPFVTSYYGEQAGRDRRPRFLGDPLPTQTAENRFSLVEPMIVSHGSLKDGQDNVNRTRSLDDPLPTTTSRGTGYLATPVIGQPDAVLVSQHYGFGNANPSLEQPMPTATTRGLGYIATPEIANPEPVIIPQQRGAGVEADQVARPLRTITAKNGTGIAIPAPSGFVTPNFGERNAQKPLTHSLDAPLPTATSHGAGMLVRPDVATLNPMLPFIIVDGACLQLDVTYRMLACSEVSRAMSLDRDGKRFVFATKSKSAIIRMLGNAVEAETARKLIRHAMAYRFEAGEGQRHALAVAA